MRVQLDSAPDCDGLWTCLDSAFQDFADFRDASLDRWHRKADLASGQGLLRSGGLKALNQPISAQASCRAHVATFQTCDKEKAMRLYNQM